MVEEGSKAAFSERVSGVVRKYPFLGYMKKAAVRGRERARRDRIASSPPPNPPPAPRTDRRTAKVPVVTEMGELEEVPIVDEGEEDWRQFE